MRRLPFHAAWRAFHRRPPFTAAFGTLYSTNITPDKQTGMGNWSGTDFYRALHEGVAAGGQHLYPAFPYIYFTHITRADTDALFAYLKTLKPVTSSRRQTGCCFPLTSALRDDLLGLAVSDADPFQPDPAKSAAWNRGDYLVNGLGHCAACHTPKNFLFGDETGQGADRRGGGQLVRSHSDRRQE